MVRNGGCRFSEKIMRNQKPGAELKGD